MARLCDYCKRQVPGKSRQIVFEYGGLKFDVLKPSTVCEGCEKERWVRHFKEYGQELVCIHSGELTVNWDLYSKAAYSRRGADIFNDILINLGIFSFTAQGNWEIMAVGGIGLNPRSLSLLSLFFTRQKDAEAYARINYAGTLYSWEIYGRLDVYRVLTKDYVLARGTK